MTVANLLVAAKAAGIALSNSYAFEIRAVDRQAGKTAGSIAKASAPTTTTSASAVPTGIASKNGATKKSRRKRRAKSAIARSAVASTPVASVTLSSPEAELRRLVLDLAKRPVDCIECTFVHELTQLIDGRHDDRFRWVLDRHLPRWDAVRRALNARVAGGSVNREWRRALETEAAGGVLNRAGDAARRWLRCARATDAARACSDDRQVSESDAAPARWCETTPLALLLNLSDRH